MSGFDEMGIEDEGGVGHFGRPSRARTREGNGLEVQVEFEPAFAEVLGDLGAVFSNLRDPSKRLVAIWFRQLRRFSPAVILEARDRVLRDVEESTIRPALFIRYADECAKDEERSALPTPITCAEPSCDRCGGSGEYVRELVLDSGEAFTMALRCEGPPE